MPLEEAVCRWGKQFAVGGGSEMTFCILGFSKVGRNIATPFVARLENVQGFRIHNAPTLANVGFSQMVLASNNRSLLKHSLWKLF